VKQGTTDQLFTRRKYLKIFSIIGILIIAWITSLVLTDFNSERRVPRSDNAYSSAGGVRQEINSAKSNIEGVRRLEGSRTQKQANVREIEIDVNDLRATFDEQRKNYYKSNSKVLFDSEKACTLLLPRMNSAELDDLLLRARVAKNSVASDKKGMLSVLEEFEKQVYWHSKEQVKVFTADESGFVSSCTFFNFDEKNVTLSPIGFPENFPPAIAHTDPGYLSVGGWGAAEERYFNESLPPLFKMAMARTAQEYRETN
jgi:hypothetical protein